jgi:hypothetical protein
MFRFYRPPVRAPQPQRSVEQSVADAVRRATRPLIERIEALEAQQRVETVVQVNISADAANSPTRLAELLQAANTMGGQ